MQEYFIQSHLIFAKVNLDNPNNHKLTNKLLMCIIKEIILDKFETKRF